MEAVQCLGGEGQPSASLGCPCGCIGMRDVGPSPGSHLPAGAPWTCFLICKGRYRSSSQDWWCRAVGAHTLCVCAHVCVGTRPMVSIVSLLGGHSGHLAEDTGSTVLDWQPCPLALAHHANLHRKSKAPAKWGSRHWCLTGLLRWPHSCCPSGSLTGVSCPHQGCSFGGHPLSRGGGGRKVAWCGQVLPRPGGYIPGAEVLGSHCRCKHLPLLVPCPHLDLG